jgi:hypothetical protein
MMSVLFLFACTVLSVVRSSCCYWVRYITVPRWVDRAADSTQLWMPLPQDLHQEWVLVNDKIWHWSASHFCKCMNSQSLLQCS